MVRAPSVDQNGKKKGAWSEEEDEMLRDYVLRNGHRNWRQLPNLAGLSRCGKSCRLRWVNYLRPGIKRGNFSRDEDQLILNLHKQLGNKWSAIAARLPGRSDNEIKNHWHSRLKKFIDNLGFIESSKEQSRADDDDAQSVESSDKSQVIQLQQMASFDLQTEPFSCFMDSALFLSNGGEEGITSNDAGETSFHERSDNKAFMLPADSLFADEEIESLLNDFP